MVFVRGIKTLDRRAVVFVRGIKIYDRTKIVEPPRIGKVGVLGSDPFVWERGPSMGLNFQEGERESP